MGISPSAIVSPEARLASDVEVGPFTVIHAGVQIDTGSRIGAYCELGVPTPLGDGSPLVIGARALIRSHSVFYASSTFGEGLETGHRVTVREGTRGGVDLRIGTLCDVQGDCGIGDHARLHSGVFVAKGSRIGRYAWLMPHAMLTNDPTPPSDACLGCEIGDFAVVAARAVILPGVRVGRHALVAAQACVGHDVADGMLVAGVPARLIGRADRVQLRPPLEGPAYPWPRHFRRGYPPGALPEQAAATTPAD